MSGLGHGAGELGATGVHLGAPLACVWGWETDGTRRSPPHMASCAPHPLNGLLWPTPTPWLAVPAPCLLQWMSNIMYKQQKFLCREHMWFAYNDFTLVPALMATSAALFSANFARPVSAWVAAAVLFVTHTIARPVVSNYHAAWRAFNLCQFIAGGPRLFALARLVRRASAQRAASPCSPPA